MTPEPLFLLDTNVIINAAKGQDKLLRSRVAEFYAGELALSAISFAELERGWVLGHLDAGTVRGFLELMLVMPFDAAAAKGFAQIMTEPEKAPKGAFDRLIAGHALSLGIPIVTSNKKDFRRLEKVQVEDWSSSA